jgi:hypothetical protein
MIPRHALDRGMTRVLCGYQEMIGIISIKNSFLIHKSTRHPVPILVAIWASRLPGRV